MSDPPRSWAEKVADAIDKLVGVTSITWGNEGNWRSPHVRALKDFPLPRTQDPYTLQKGDTVYFSNAEYPAQPARYKLHDGKTVPAENVTMLMLTGEDGKEKPQEARAPGASTISRQWFYVGIVKEPYSFEPPPQKTIPQGRTAYLPAGQDSGPSYQVKDARQGLFEGTVDAGFVQICKVGDTVPKHEIEPIQLMCYELFPYAAMHAGLMTAEEFFQGLDRPSPAATDPVSGSPVSGSPDSGSEYWAERLGEPLDTKPELELEALKTKQFRRGDIIVLYTNGKGGGIHTMVAAGSASSTGEPLVYSLSELPTNNPGRWPITQVVNTFAKNNPKYGKAVTPPRTA